MSRVPGLATITATDYDSASANILVEGSGIPMQETGNPLIILLIAILTPFAIRLKK